MKTKFGYNKKRLVISLFFCINCMLALSCSMVVSTYLITTGVVKTTYRVTKCAAKVVYTVGGFTFDVVMAPINWPLTHDDLESIDGLSPKEAIRQNRVKLSPYVVNGKKYVPMGVEKAKKYREKGTASWYGYETYHSKGGHMTANGEAFHPNGLTAAHKYLPLPTYVRVTNLENRKALIVRVNDRGPFVEGRIIDLSAGAAKKLGFYDEGTAMVLVETVQVDDMKG